MRVRHPEETRQEEEAFMSRLSQICQFTAVPALRGSTRHEYVKS